MAKGTLILKTDAHHAKSCSRFYSIGNVLHGFTGLSSALFALFLLTSSTLMSQSVGKISGVVTDSETGEPLIGCNVVITGTRMGAATDVTGNYFILNITPGKYTIQASMLGYEKVAQTDVIVNAGKTTTVDFKLRSTTIVGQEVVIQAKRPDVQLDKTSTGEIVRTEDVQQIAGMRDVSDVIGLAADVTDGHFRGGRDGEELYTLQGMGILNPLDNSSAFLPIMSAVEEVEVVTSGFGAQYGNAQSGVVNISMKEGKSDKWHTRAEARMRLPGRKHFGPSVFDPNANPYLSLLMADSTWRRRDASSGSGASLYYTGMASGISNLYGLDTAVQIQVARTLWNLQARRDMNRNYGNEIDRSFEFGTGGPIDDNKTMFLAMRTNTEWPFLPTNQPDIHRQFMGNLVADLGNSATVRLSGAHSQDDLNIFPSLNGLGFYNWLWDRTMDIEYRQTNNDQLGLRFTQATSPSTYYEIKLNALQTHLIQGSSPSPSSVPDSFIVVLSNQIQWAKTLTGTQTSPDKFAVGNGQDDFRDELTRTVSVEGSLTSQVTKNHQLNGGLQYNYYFIDVANRSNVRVAEGGPDDLYSARPMELGLYGQDKMEFEGMIANVGVRFDLWDQNSSYYPDQISPFRQVTISSTGDTSVVMNADSVQRKQSAIVGRLQPRIGFSFPVSTTTVFHLNYGSFMQRPSFQYTIRTQATPTPIGPNLIILGNPELRPQITNSYDMGVTQGFGDGFTFDVSGYYKDVKDLVESLYFTDFLGNTYQTYFNRDYADIRGFRLSLNKRRGELTGSINYQYSVATGKSSTPTNAPVSYTETSLGVLSTRLQPSAQDILLDFDRTHNLIINVGYATEQQWGPAIGDVYPFGDFYLSLNSFIRSGRPYTYDPNSLGILNNMRTPTEYNTNLRLTKKIRDFFGSTATIYFEVFNLFDNKILNYNYLFAQATPSATSNNVSNDLINYYQTLGLNNPSGVRYYNDTNRGTPFGVDMSFLLYENSPRSYNLGFVIEF
jgi:outer membrane receptor protein involved in Fe transport